MKNDWAAVFSDWDELGLDPWAVHDRWDPIKHYPEEGPGPAVTVEGFWMQTHQVTNTDFAEFIAATGYLTVAERD